MLLILIALAFWGGLIAWLFTRRHRQEQPPDLLSAIERMEPMRQPDDTPILPHPPVERSDYWVSGFIVGDTNVEFEHPCRPVMMHELGDFWQGYDAGAAAYRKARTEEQKP